MRWYQHYADERNLIASKVVRRKFGAEGYGIFTVLKEVVAENIEDNNFKDWGSVDDLHDLESLAEECGTTAEKLKEFLEFCDEKTIFEKRNGKLYWGEMLNRLDNYASRIGRQNKLNRSRNKIQTKSAPSTNKVRTKYDIHNNTIQDNTVHNITVQKKSNYSSISNIKEPEFELVANSYQVSVAFVRSCYDDLVNYCESKPKKYKNYLAALRKFVKGSAIRLSQEQRNQKGRVVDASNL